MIYLSKILDVLFSCCVRLKIYWHHWGGSGGRKSKVHDEPKLLKVLCTSGYTVIPLSPPTQRQTFELFGLRVSLPPSDTTATRIADVGRSPRGFWRVQCNDIMRIYPPMYLYCIVLHPTHPSLPIDSHFHTADHTHTTTHTLTSDNYVIYRGVIWECNDVFFVVLRALSIPRRRRCVDLPRAPRNLKHLAHFYREEEWIYLIARPSYYFIHLSPLLKLIHCVARLAYQFYSHLARLN